MKDGHIYEFKEYFISSLKIFIILFILGKILDNTFTKIQKKYNIPLSIWYGILQLFTCIVVAYILHSFTSDNFSDEMQIYAPNVLLSSFMMSLQSNMFKNFELFEFF